MQLRQLPLAAKDIGYTTITLSIFYLVCTGKFFSFGAGEL
jgi:hypothetical protein